MILNDKIYSHVKQNIIVSFIIQKKLRNLSLECTFLFRKKLEIVMNEMRKNQNFHFDLQIHPTLINSTYLHCQMTGFTPIRVQNFQNVE